MKQIDHPLDQEVRRTELRESIRLSSEIIAKYWPMRTFVHHNPLHSLEYLPFTEAVKRGQRFSGGQGYLPSNVYRGYLHSGRILLRHLDEALKPLVHDQQVVMEPCRITHHEVLRACMTHGLSDPRVEPFDAPMGQGHDAEQVEMLTRHLATVLTQPPVREQISAAVREDQHTLGRHITLSNWCDRTLGTEIVDQVNQQLVKWCEGYLDEGHAAWSMPNREHGLYETWKTLAAQEWSPCGIADSRRKIAQLPAHPEDAVLDSLDALGIPEEFRQDYLSLQLASLPGWAGFIKWRAEGAGYEWQQAYPVGLVQYLAIRLWYVRELVQKICQEELGIEGNYHAISTYMYRHSQAYFFRKERAAGRLPASYAEQVARACNAKPNRQSGSDDSLQDWEHLTDLYQAECGPRHDRALQRASARRLLTLADALEIVPAVLLKSAPEDLKVLVEWMDAFPESEHAPVWLNAFEAGWHEQLFGMLTRTIRKLLPVVTENLPPVRPHSQSVFCIDVRSGPFRRHLEAIGMNETFGFAGFFAVLIRYRAWGKKHDTVQAPVIVQARHAVNEIPRYYLDHIVSMHETRVKLLHARHTLIHDLKENVVTPYVMVESLGWFYFFPIIGKTILPALYRRWTDWLRHLLVPEIATSVTVDKLMPADTDEMLGTEQRAIIMKALHEQFNLHGTKISPQFVEALRRNALQGDDATRSYLSETAQSLNLSMEELTTFVEKLRQIYRIDKDLVSGQAEELSRTGFTLEEQVTTVSTALRMMGLTRNFARIVLFCGHGSTTDNNPFESALECGACGGNEGKSNARVLASMANKHKVKEQLAKNGIQIPSDTHFLAGQVNTTTDEVEVFDLEDVPPTHRRDVTRLLEDLKEAGQLTSQERCTHFPEIHTSLTPQQAAAHVYRRSVDWSQTRPEWGLSGNTTFIIARREITKGLNLAGRVFLHSYDYLEDPTDSLLEVLMTAPQVVVQWINMEHYFSTVDNEIYGAGTKIYHNVVGNFGVMSGPWSDLRLGLSRQTVMNGDVPYHEPMRLLTVIEAPRARIEKLINKHPLLQQYYHNEWVHLVAIEPDEGVLYRYLPSGIWRQVKNTTA